MNSFGFKPKIVPLLFNRLIFAETVDLYTSDFIDEAHRRWLFMRFIGLVGFVFAIKSENKI